MLREILFLTAAIELVYPGTVEKVARGTVEGVSQYLRSLPPLDASQYSPPAFPLASPSLNYGVPCVKCGEPLYGLSRCYRTGCYASPSHPIKRVANRIEPRRLKAAPPAPTIEPTPAPVEKREGKKRGGRTTLNKKTCERLNYYAAQRLEGLDDDAARKATARRDGVGIGNWKSERDAVNRAVEMYLDGGHDRDWSQVKF